MKNRPFHIRLRFALAGITTVWRCERSFRSQSVLAAAAIAALLILRPGLIWTALVLIAIVLVLTLELVNSALEYLLDHLHPARADAIRDAKDAAAGAVLLASFAAASIVGMLVIARLF